MLPTIAFETPPGGPDGGADPVAARAVDQPPSPPEDIGDAPAWTLLREGGPARRSQSAGWPGCDGRASCILAGCALKTLRHVRVPSAVRAVVAFMDAPVFPVELAVPLDRGRVAMGHASQLRLDRLPQRRGPPLSSPGGLA